MSSLVNPVPTSGQVREIRRRIRRHLPPAIERIVHKPDIRAELARDTDLRPAKVYDAVISAAEGTADTATDAADADVPAIVGRVVAAVSAGLDVVERISDDVHDAVEENLARVAGLPRILGEVAKHDPRSGVTR